MRIFRRRFGSVPQPWRGQPRKIRDFLAANSRQVFGTRNVKPRNSLSKKFKLSQTLTSLASASSLHCLFLAILLAQSVSGLWRGMSVNGLFGVMVILRDHPVWLQTTWREENMNFKKERIIKLIKLKL